MPNHTNTFRLAMHLVSLPLVKVSESYVPPNYLSAVKMPESYVPSNCLSAVKMPDLFPKKLSLAFKVVLSQRDRLSGK